MAKEEIDFENIAVNDRQSFVQFLEVFRNDLIRNPGQGENRNLEDFLEAFARYAEDIQGYYNNRREEIGSQIDANIPSWSVFADMLKGARVYE